MIKEQAGGRAAEPVAQALPVLYFVVCAAAPAVHAERLVRYARGAGWDVWVIATQAAVEYLIDPTELEQASGHPVRTGYRVPQEFRAMRRADAPGITGHSCGAGDSGAGGGSCGAGDSGAGGGSCGSDDRHEPVGLPPAAAAIVAPATYNTINKLAIGIADSFPLSTLTELMGCRVPIVVLPFVNSAFAATAAFGRSVEALRSEGVRVLLGPGGFEPHPPRTGEQHLTRFPWELAVDALAVPDA